MTSLRRERSLDVLSVAAPTDSDDDSRSFFDPLQSALALDKSLTPNNEGDEVLINKIVSKDAPMPLQHSHNIRAHHTLPRGSSIAQSETNSTNDISITSYSESGCITPDQWMFIKRKMHGLSPILIEMPQQQDSTSTQYIVDSDDNHQSDDEVLYDPRFMTNHTWTTPTNHIKHKSKTHECKASMTVSFDPNGVDQVVNALDALQTFCASVPGVYATTEQQFDEESRDQDIDEQTNDSVLVLSSDFDKNHHIGSEYSYDVANPMRVINKRSEYEQLRFNILNRTAHLRMHHDETRSSRTSDEDVLIGAFGDIITAGADQMDQPFLRDNLRMLNDDNDSCDRDYRAASYDEEMSCSKPNNSKQSIKSNAKHSKLSSKTTVIKDKDPENIDNTRTSAVKIQNYEHHNKPSKSKRKSMSNKITFSEILSHANNRNAAVIASPSLSVDPVALHGAPLQAAQSHAEMSADYADEYEYSATTITNHMQSDCNQNDGKTQFIPLHRFTPQNLCDHIKTWVLNDADYQHN
eukprot:929530_1